MADGILHPQRTEVVVRGDGNCFYRAIALWRDETSDRNMGKFEACVAPILRNIRRYFSHSCLHHVYWRNMLRKVNLLGLGQKLLTSLVVQRCSRELLTYFQLKKKVAHF